jgi:hypothetical protein
VSCVTPEPREEPNPILRSAAAAAIVALAVLTPRPAIAQPSDEWQINFAPLYFWATELNGSMTARNTTIPIFLEFADAADSLGAAFSFHFEGGKGRWGLLSDLYFVRLSSDAEFTLPNRVVQGSFDLDNTIFELGGSYLVSESARFAVIGGLRTYLLSPKLEFTSSGVQVEPVDTSKTSANVFGGFTYRPRIAEKWTFSSRADIGAGDAEVTWSGTLGFEYRFRPWGGLFFGYKALGIDTGGDDDITEYDVTHYGPAFGLNLHWGGR